MYKRKYFPWDPSLAVQPTEKGTPEGNRKEAERTKRNLALSMASRPDPQDPEAPYREVFNERCGTEKDPTTLINSNFRAALMPALDACIRIAFKKSSPAGTLIEGPIKLLHLGIYKAPQSPSARLDFHNAARAIDLTAVRIGDRTFEYTEASKKRDQPDSEWNSFWAPLTSCLKEQNKYLITLTDPETHSTHVHVSLRYHGPGDPPPPGELYEGSWVRPPERDRLLTTVRGLRPARVSGPMTKRVKRRAQILCAMTRLSLRETCP